MPCNPAIGGLGKGQLVREIDALGGQMAKTSDESCIQFKVLNSSKGPAVRGLRAQADKYAYSANMRKTLENTPGLDIKQALVQKISCADSAVNGIITETNTLFKSKTIIITTGTFLNGILYTGLQSFKGGRSGEPPSNSLSESLKSLGLKLGRMKTGTNPRADGRSLDHSFFTLQPGDETPVPFSFSTESINIEQIPCWLVNTTEETRKVILDNIERSPLYSPTNRMINSIGPRYCPSIEDKIIKFPDKKTHQVFIEPEGLNTNEVYLNGLSTSLPRDVQLKYLRTIPGFKNAEITRHGYAVEYDFAEPFQLNRFLECREIPGLFLAGQINGTSGYEEAAAQGLTAGINAYLKISGKEMFAPSREESYIGVMIDDLITKEVTEPYRMFTSRSEHRLVLRNDNADVRLMPYGRKFGLIDDKTFKRCEEKTSFARGEAQRLSKIYIRPDSKTDAEIKKLGEPPLKHEVSLLSLLKRPGIKYEDLAAFTDINTEDPAKKEYLESESKYEGYIKKQEDNIKFLKKTEYTIIPPDFNYSIQKGLTLEAVQKLNKFRPETLGAASRIQGITPGDINVLIILLKKHNKTRG